MQTFKDESLISAEKVAGSWLANAKWRQRPSDGTRFSKSNNEVHKSNSIRSEDSATSQCSKQSTSKSLNYRRPK